jgi:hypothetical protein
MSSCLSEKVIRAVESWSADVLAVTITRAESWYHIAPGHPRLADLGRSLLKADPTRRCGLPRVAVAEIGPLCATYQSLRDEWLPRGLQSANPWDLPRRVSACFNRLARLHEPARTLLPRCSKRFPSGSRPHIEDES